MRRHLLPLAIAAVLALWSGSAMAGASFGIHLVVRAPVIVHTASVTLEMGAGSRSIASSHVQPVVVQLPAELGTVEKLPVQGGPNGIASSDDPDGRKVSSLVRMVTILIQ